MIDDDRPTTDHTKHADGTHSPNIGHLHDDAYMGHVLAELMDSYGISHVIGNTRLTAREFDAQLSGILWGIEQARKGD